MIFLRENFGGLLRIKFIVWFLRRKAFRFRIGSSIILFKCLMKSVWMLLLYFLMMLCVSGLSNLVVFCLNMLIFVCKLMSSREKTSSGASSRDKSLSSAAKLIFDCVYCIYS